MKIAFINKTRPGVTMLFVLMFMIVASLLGSSLMYLSSSQSSAGGDYFAKKTADEAAESALDWFQGAVEDYTLNNATNMENVVTWMNEFENSNIDNRWYYCTATDENEIEKKDITTNFKVSTEVGATHISLGSDGILKAKLKIESVDKTNQIVVIKAVGFGKNNSRKTIRAVYRLEGAFADSIFYYIPDTDLYGKNAIHLEGEGKNFDIAVNIEGDVYVGGDFHFNAGEDAHSTINGNFYTAPSDIESSIDQSVEVSGNCYIQTPLKMNSKENFVVTGNFATENYVYGASTGDFNITGNAYLTRPDDGAYSGITNGGSTAPTTVFTVGGNMYLEQTHKLDGDADPFINVTGDLDINYYSNTIGNMNGEIRASGDIDYYDEYSKLEKKIGQIYSSNTSSVSNEIDNPLTDNDFFESEFEGVERFSNQTQPSVSESNIPEDNIFDATTLNLTKTVSGEVHHKYSTSTV